MNNEEEEVRPGFNVTVGVLRRRLQEIASQYGDDTPVVTFTETGADYEQATVPFVLHAERESVPDDWDLFHVATTGEAVAVIL